MAAITANVRNTKPNASHASLVVRWSTNAGTPLTLWIDQRVPARNAKNKPAIAPPRCPQLSIIVPALNPIIRLTARIMAILTRLFRPRLAKNSRFCQINTASATSSPKVAVEAPSELYFPKTNDKTLPPKALIRYSNQKRR